MLLNSQKTSSLLTRDLSTCLKGLFTLAVLLHHIYLHTRIFAGSIPGKILEMMGYWSVSVFFFLSGYGLMLSWMQKGMEYVAQLPKNRILPLYIKYLILTVIYGVFSWFSGSPFPLSDLPDALVLNKVLITYGWYLKTILLFYLFYYAVFRWFRSYALSAGILSGCVLGYMGFCWFSGADSATYVSCLSFLLGLCAGKKRQSFFHIFEKEKVSILLSFAATGLWILLYLITPGGPVRYFAKTFSSPCFVILVLALVNFVMRRWDALLCNPLLHFTGNLSLEIYTIQGLFLNLFKGPLLNIENTVLYILTVFVSTFFAAYLLHRFWRILRL